MLTTRQKQEALSKTALFSDLRDGKLNKSNSGECTTPQGIGNVFTGIVIVLSRYINRAPQGNAQKFPPTGRQK